MHKGNSNQQQPCLPCLFHISSFALPSTGASKDKRVQVGNETPDNGLEALRRGHAPALSFSVLSRFAPASSFCSLPASGGKSISIKMRTLGKTPALRQQVLTGRVRGEQR